MIQQSNNPYSSLVILVKKKNGSCRFCVDYQDLNRATVTNKFHILVIDELLDELHESNVVFNKLDLKSCYHQIRAWVKDVLKTAFCTHDGHYKFKVMPFCNEPIFQKKIFIFKYQNILIIHKI